MFCMERKCSVIGCNKKYQAKGYCNGHYSQVARGVSITVELKPIAQRVPIKERLLSKIKVNEEGCWVWQASLDKHGYGQFWDGKMMTRAHRVCYKLLVKEGLKSEESLDHLCRNKSCINPDHLEVVTLTVNSRRMHVYRRLEAEIDRLRNLLIQNGIDPEGEH